MVALCEELKDKDQIMRQKDAPMAPVIQEISKVLGALFKELITDTNFM